MAYLSSRIWLWLSLAVLAMLCSGCRPCPPVSREKRIARIQLAELRGALQLYCFDVGRYPSTAEGLDALLRNAGQLASWKGPYLSKAAITRDPWQRPYIYRRRGPRGTYELVSLGRDGVEGGRGEDADISRALGN
jgi:general secretion pathway protein G